MERAAWLDAGGGEVLGLAGFHAVGEALDVAGLAALDQLLCLRLQHGLSQLLSGLQGAAREPGALPNRHSCMLDL